MNKNAPMWREEAITQMRDAVLKAGKEIEAFEKTAAIVSQMDDEFLVDANGRHSVAQMRMESSPARKRKIAACQFAIQKANMYSAYATAVGIAYHDVW